MRRVAILAATARELAPAQTVIGLLGPLRRGRVGRFDHHVGRVEDVELHFIKTGIGNRNARLAAEAVQRGISPDAIISTGYIGALGPEGVAALIVATGIHDWIRERYATAIAADSALLAAAGLAAREAGIGWTKGPIITVANVVWRASEKQALATASGAIGVDMESAAIARVAALGKVPFLAVRAVSDKVGDDLPLDFNLWLSSFGLIRGILEVMTHPSLLRGLYRMKCHADEADETLRRFFTRFVMALPSCQLPPHPDLSVAIPG
jgi:adenosylhomocysteine nucleosidase